MSYHDLHITTARIPRTSIFNMPYDYLVSCSRVRGWSLSLGNIVLAEEYGASDNWLVLDNDGTIIVDSREKAPDD